MLHLGIQTFTVFDDYWNILPDDVKFKLEAFVAELPKEYFDDIGDILNYTPLTQLAAARIQIASRDDLSGLSFVFMQCLLLLQIGMPNCIQIQKFQTSRRICVKIRTLAEWLLLNNSTGF